ncbi:carboxypeptidase-like regulatory domain-containing protein, partial [Parabacteroides distasonis]
MKRKCLCAALAVSCAINVSFAQVRLQGKVVDESNEPIPGANIRVSESLNGTTTDASGKFELNLPDGRHRIRVTYLGYEQGVYQTDHSEKDVVIKLKEKYVNIDQVVVTGTGSHRRMSNSPIPVKVLTGKDLKEASVTNFQDAMTKLNPSIVFMENGQGATMNMNGLTEKYVVILE